MSAPSLLSRARNRWRTQLWPLPAVGIVVAVLLGVGLPRVDRAIDDRLPSAVTDYLFGGGATSARAVLEAVSGSLITVAAPHFMEPVIPDQIAAAVRGVVEAPSR